MEFSGKRFLSNTNPNREYSFLEMNNYKNFNKRRNLKVSKGKISKGISNKTFKMYNNKIIYPLLYTFFSN